MQYAQELTPYPYQASSTTQSTRRWTLQSHPQKQKGRRGKRQWCLVSGRIRETVGKATKYAGVNYWRETRHIIWCILSGWNSKGALSFFGKWKSWWILFCFPPFSCSTVDDWSLMLTQIWGERPSCTFGVQIFREIKNWIFFWGGGWLYIVNWLEEWKTTIRNPESKSECLYWILFPFFLLGPTNQPPLFQSIFTVSSEKHGNFVNRKSRYWVKEKTEPDQSWQS